MMIITDEPFRADVDEVLARYGLDDPGHAVLASDLSDAFDEALRDAAAEVSRLRAAAGERDALREAVSSYLSVHDMQLGFNGGFERAFDRAVDKLRAALATEGKLGQ